MKFVYVDSSNIDQAGYDEMEREFHVLFKRSGHYIYSDIPAEVWDDFQHAPSKGQFINNEIKAKGYPFRKA